MTTITADISFKPLCVTPNLYEWNWLQQVRHEVNCKVKNKTQHKLTMIEQQIQEQRLKYIKTKPRRKAD